MAVREVERRKAEGADIAQRLDGMVIETAQAQLDVGRQRELCHQIHEANQRKQNELNAQTVELTRLKTERQSIEAVLMEKTRGLTDHDR